VGTANPWKVADWPRAEWSVIANEKQKRSFDSYEASGEVSQSSIHQEPRPEADAVDEWRLSEMKSAWLSAPLAG
jgi:hypothetical protein